MGLMRHLFDLLFGGDASRAELRKTLEVFRENADASAARSNDHKLAVLRQFQHEFAQPNRSPFDRVIDGVNRLPRPGMALGTLALFVAAMVDPIWFAARMQGIALVPDPLWWLLGAIVSFYFGARHQLKGQAFQTQLSQTLAQVPVVVENLRELDQLQIETAAAQDVTAAEALIGERNPALDAWRQNKPGRGATM